MLWSGSAAQITCSLAGGRGGSYTAEPRSSYCSCAGGCLARKSGGAFGGATLSISKAFPKGPPVIVATQDQCLLSLRASFGRGVPTLVPCHRAYC